MQNENTTKSKALQGMTNEDLADLHSRVSTEIDSRREGFDMSRIRVGMSEEEQAVACNEITRILKEAGN